MADQVLIEGDLARSIARLPDDLALDFLREYHDIMCPCGNNDQDELWQQILTSIRADTAAQQQQPATVPDTVRRGRR